MLLTDHINFSGTNPFGGVWEIQVTGEHLWALGEFEYVNAGVRRAIARFPSLNNSFLEADGNISILKRQA